MSDDVTNWHAYHEHEHNDSPAEQSGRYSLRDEITEMVGVIMTAGEGLTPEWKTITWEPPPAPWLAEIEAMRLAYNAAIDMHGALIAELDKRQAGLDVRLKAIEAIQRAAGDPDVYDMYMCNSDACGWAGMGWECAHQPHDPACYLCPECHETTMHLPQEEAVKFLRDLRGRLKERGNDTE